MHLSTRRFSTMGEEDEAPDDDVGGWSVPQWAGRQTGTRDRCLLLDDPITRIAPFLADVTSATCFPGNLISYQCCCLCDHAMGSFFST